MLFNGEPTIADGGPPASGVEAAREVILWVLNPRFGPPPPAFRERLAEIDDLARLHEIVEQALEVDSIDDLGLS